jgi:hypothetical protein
MKTRIALTVPLALLLLGVEYASHNNGSHIVIKHGSKVVDFWPSTGLWIIRGVGGYARGINKLLIKLGVKK